MCGDLHLVSIEREQADGRGIQAAYLRYFLWSDGVLRSRGAQAMYVWGHFDGFVLYISYRTGKTQDVSFLFFVEHREASVSLFIEYA